VLSNLVLEGDNPSNKPLHADLASAAWHLRDGRASPPPPRHAGERHRWPGIMMLRSGVAASFLALALMVGIGRATTDVTQKYRFLALTTWNEQDVFWILEDTSGEGEGSRILQVVLDDGNEPVLVQTWFKHFGSWQWLVEAVGSLDTQEYTPLMEGRGTFVDWMGRLFVEEPPADTLSLQEFDDFVYRGPGTVTSWNAARGLSGISSPIVHGAESEVLYIYPEGLYLGYHLSEVYHFAWRRYLLVFTHQDKTGPGFDTMHGFIIMRIGKSEE
jgi:hypothetical protein